MNLEFRSSKNRKERGKKLDRKPALNENMKRSDRRRLRARLGEAWPAAGRSSFPVRVARRGAAHPGMGVALGAGRGSTTACRGWSTAAAWRWCVGRRGGVGRALVTRDGGVEAGSGAWRHGLQVSAPAMASAGGGATQQRLAGGAGRG